MNNKQFSQRLHDAGLSLWELGDFLGIHPHELRSAGKPGALLAQPVRVLVDLARRLDLHPADLVEDLEPVLSTRRLTPTPAAAETEPDTGADALVLLTTLAMTSVPLDSDDLADILGWSSESRPPPVTPSSTPTSVGRSVYGGSRRRPGPSPPASTSSHPSSEPSSTTGRTTARH